jgi:lipid A oxidase
MSRARWPVAFALLALATVVEAMPAAAEVQVAVYGGANANLSSAVALRKGGVSDDRTVDWEGRSFEMPPYWGVQAAYWLTGGAGFGLAVDYTHAKAYAKIDFATDPVYRHLEFTDGNNLLILNLLYRFEPVLGGKLVPYVGIGAGVAIPHVEVKLKVYPGWETWEYQLAGAAGQLLGGLEYRLGDAWSVFAQGKLSYAHLDTELAGGGTLTSDLWSPQVVLGLSYRFGN